MKQGRPGAFILGIIVGGGLFFVGTLLVSPAARLYLGFYLGERDYEYITSLRDKLERDPTNGVLLDKIVARTKVSESLSRANAIGVLEQLSFFNSVTGKQIHSRVLPIFVQALNDEDQSTKRAALEGIENLGPYAVQAIPDVKKKLNDNDPIIREEAQTALATLQKYEHP
jgi:hypothetical protein